MKTEIEYLKDRLRKAEEMQQENIYLLNRCKKQVGMDIGEDIEKQLADMKGMRFSSVDYHAERMPGEQ